MTKQDIQEGMALLRPFLRAYLTQHGIEIDASGHFPCPAHDDHNPSANFITGTDETKWWCHVDNIGGDILDACHYIEGKPQSGVGWYKETFLYLCDEFNIKINGPDRTLSAEDQKQLEVDQAFDRVAKLILGMKNSDRVEAKLADYAWSKRTLRTFGIGGVTSYDKYLAEMSKAGFSKAFLKEVGLDDRRIFRAECLIFTIKDANGRPIAFAGRWLDFEAADKKLAEIGEEKGIASLEYAKAKEKWQPKYVNTKFKKGEILFGFHAAKANSRSLYVFEGYADCVTAFNAGLINSVAVCGNAWNEHHMEIAKAAGIRHIINCFDSDAGGESGKQSFVDFAEKQGLTDWRFDLLEVPKPEGEKKVDPDLFIRANGLAAFRKLEVHSHFFWAMRSMLKTEDNLTVANLGTQRILKQTNAILCWGMLQQLNQATGVPIEFLWDSVVRLAEQDHSELSKSLVARAQRMTWMKEHLKEAKQIIQQPNLPAPEPPGHLHLVGTGLAPMTTVDITLQVAAAAGNWK